MKKILIIIFAFSLVVPFFPAQAAGIDLVLSKKLSGRILLQVENNGEAWYVNPKNLERYYLGRPDDAFKIMRELGLGITTKDFNKIPVVGAKAIDPVLTARLSGRIILEVEKNGEAWYIYPVNLKKYYLGRPADAFKIMRELGLGITNNDLDKIKINSGSEAQVSSNANLYFGADKNYYNPGDKAVVTLKIDSGNQVINAMEGELVYDNNLLEIVDFDKSKSFFNSWPRGPIASGVNKILFTGGVFNGFSGNAQVFTTIFKVKARGKANLSLNNYRLLLNDGFGTIAKTSVSGLVLNSLAVTTTTGSTGGSSTTSGSTGGAVAVIKPTELFVYREIHDLLKASTIHFNAVDDVSGVDYYLLYINSQPAIKTTADNYYISGAGSYTVKIRAYNKAGNYIEKTINFVN